MYKSEINPKKIHIIFLTSLFIFLQQGSARSQSAIGSSFDCARATDALAMTVCNDQNLLERDRSLLQIYYVLRHALPGQLADLRRGFLDFHRDIISSCSLPGRGPVDAGQLSAARSCIGGHYQRQTIIYMKEVIDTQNAAAAEEARRPHLSHRNLQQRLKDLGYLPENAIIDGIYGTGTRSAIRNFQQINNIVIDGFMSDATQRALVSNPRPLSQIAASSPISAGPAASGVSAPSAAGRPTNSPAASSTAGNQPASGSFSLWWLLLLVPAVWVMLRLLAGTKKLAQHQSESLPNENSYAHPHQNRNDQTYENPQSSYITQVYEKQSKEKEILNPWGSSSYNVYENEDKKDKENNNNLKIDENVNIHRRKCSSCGSNSFEEKRTSSGVCYFSCQFCGVSAE